MTRSFRLSPRNANVVGPIAARLTTVVDTPLGSSRVGRSKCWRNKGVANSAAEGAKNTIHQWPDSEVSHLLDKICK